MQGPSGREEGTPRVYHKHNEEELKHFLELWISWSYSCGSLWELRCFAGACSLLLILCTAHQPVSCRQPVPHREELWFRSSLPLRCWVGSSRRELPSSSWSCWPGSSSTLGKPTGCSDVQVFWCLKAGSTCRVLDVDARCIWMWFALFSDNREF